ncbi:MAG: hypothetical protein VX733_09455 [Candidatus Latescibacterota bacterium]|nr:hypothetical protein [Candidatus Latescibacterota bacterium]
MSRNCPVAFATGRLFCLDEPSAEEVASFHRDGFIVYPDVCTDEAREGLIEEVLSYDPVAELLNSATKSADGQYFFERPWNNRGPWGHALIDAPFVQALLRATVKNPIQFCHSALNVALRGVDRVRYHMDHHHWVHENPVNIAERDGYYIQILYYPNGFRCGDRSLSIIPGSHKVAPTSVVTPERLLSGDYDEEAGRRLEERALELPPGSMVYLNARVFHGVEPKPLDTKQDYRIFVIDIFKEAGPPHRHTQVISDEWMAQANPVRRQLFDRDPYTEGCWESQLRPRY